MLNIRNILSPPPATSRYVSPCLFHPSDDHRFPLLLNGLCKFFPSRCRGQLALHNVTFAYNSNSTTSSPMIDFLPANELTFPIGPSDSGKSIAQFLLSFQSPPPGNDHVTIDKQDLRFLDDSSCSSGKVSVPAVEVVVETPLKKMQDPPLCMGPVSSFSQSIFDNTALAPSSDPSTVPFHRVVEACRAASL